MTGISSRYIRCAGGGNEVAGSRIDAAEYEVVLARREVDPVNARQEARIVFRAERAEFLEHRLRQRVHRGWDVLRVLFALGGGDDDLFEPIAGGLFRQCFLCLNGGGRRDRRGNGCRYGLHGIRIVLAHYRLPFANETGRYSANRIRVGIDTQPLAGEAAWFRL
ncbi:MAG: hypothetical protein OXP09_11415 [Gammaproteobacteria bacterium]|nr:hypothetical protein [Gammaproteobacteria bacterium]